MIKKGRVSAGFAIVGLIGATCLVGINSPCQATQIAAGGSGQTRILLVPPPAEIPRTDQVKVTPPKAGTMVGMTQAGKTALNAGTISVQKMPEEVLGKAVRTAPAAPQTARVKPSAEPQAATHEGQPRRKRVRRLRPENTQPQTAQSVSAHATAATAPAAKAGPLFSYVRLLNYSPHPQVEAFLRDKPLELQGRKYWFTVTYHEDWHVTGDYDGNLKGIAFQIDIYEGEEKVRSVTTPQARLNPKSLKKGQILGVAEIAPYKFVVKLSNFVLQENRVTDLEFRMDLFG